MKISELMSRPVHCCTTTSTLAEAAGEMWSGDCGMVPVVRKDERIAGVITDRDICMAAASRNRTCNEITVDQVITGEVWCCSPDDDSAEALATMATHQVRRLPVIDEKKHVVGVISLNDLILEAREKPVSRKQEKPLKFADVMDTLQKVDAHRYLPTQQADGPVETH